MEPNKQSQGELTRRLYVGFEKVLESVGEVISAEALARALPRDVDAEAVQKDLFDALRDNCRQSFQELLDENEIPEKLVTVEASLGPIIKGKRMPYVSKQAPEELVRSYRVQKKASHKKDMELRIAQLKLELQKGRSDLDELRKKAKKTVDDLDLIKSRFAFSPDEADTEPEGM